MIKKISTYIFLLIFIFLGSFNFSSAYLSSDTSKVNLIVDNCNHDNICNAGLENFSSCPSDCLPVCNHNNICDGGEDTQSCPSDCTVTPPVVNTGYSSGSLVSGNNFINLKIEVDYNSATVRWESSIPTKTNLKWGTSLDYKDGTVQSADYSINHKFDISNLVEGKTYYFKIQSEDYVGRVEYLSNKFFTTLSHSNIIQPSNPRNVGIKVGDSGITINWQNPKDSDFDYIRVMRNINRYYSSPLAGEIVYEGRGSYFVDSNVKEKVKYYYSLFSHNKTGSYSSGALISATFNYKKETVIPSEEIPSYPADNTIPETVIPSGVTYSVVQDSSSYDFNLGTVLHLSGDSNIKIRTNYLPKNKDDSVWVEIKNVNRELVAQYFFSEERDSSGFTSVVIPPFDKEGYYTITVYGYNANISQVINQGAFQISKVSVSEPVATPKYTIWIITVSLFSFSFFLWILFIIFRRFIKG